MNYACRLEPKETFRLFCKLVLATLHRAREEFESVDFYGIQGLLDLLSECPQLVPYQPLVPQAVNYNSSKRIQTWDTPKYSRGRSKIYSRDVYWAVGLSCSSSWMDLKLFMEIILSHTLTIKRR